MSLSRLVKAAVAVQEAEQALADFHARSIVHNAVGNQLNDEWPVLEGKAAKARRELIEAARGA